MRPHAQLAFALCSVRTMAFAAAVNACKRLISTVRGVPRSVR
jgi:hypothetical protein